MPPRKAPSTSASSQRGGSKVALQASPARSTRSTRSHREDEWDNESMTSGFKVPPPRGARNLGLSMHDTSVNIAAAFNAAQTGHVPPPTGSKYRKPAPRSDAGRRALSPAEQLADSARALSPVRYFLHPGDNNESAEYPSFSSLGHQSSTNTSYDYQKEEEYVKNRIRSENGHSRKASESRRRKKAEDGDMPYRPAEDDWAAESNGSEEEDGEGEGIVNGGALDGRASTRGKTKEKGEGYLGMGLGIQPKKRQGRKSGDQMDSDDEGDRGLSPAPSYGGGRNGYSRSPTPAQLLRNLTPRLSPGPVSLTPRRRQPSTLRTVVTNLLNGVVEALRFVINSMISIMDAAFVTPIKSVAGSGKLATRKLRKNWWKILGGLLALSLLIRLLSRPWSAQTGSIKHGVIGSDTADDLASRLSSLEQAIASLSHSAGSQIGTVGTSIGDQALADRLTRLEASLADERQRLDNVRGESASFGQLRQDLDQVVSRVDRHDTDIASSSSKHQSVDRIEQELRGLRTRVDGVEAEVRNALDDGRLHKAIERILPEWMPIKRSKGGRIDIEQVFWNELKRVLVGKSEMDKAVQDALVGKATGGVSEKDLEKFGDKLFEQKSAKGLIISRDQFLQAMNNELEDLKDRLDKAEVASPQKSSTITVKGDKGDDLLPLLRSLIDTAILKYSKDTLATPDYALYTAGARVVPSITSDTLVVKSASRLGKWVAGSKDVVGRAPATALHPDNSVGSCWPFNGSQGQLGILLSRRVVITDVTIEHAAKELSPDIRTAPKAIEVWGLVEGQANKNKVSEYLATNQASQSYVPQTVIADTRSTSIPPSPDHLLLATVQYDPSAENPTQTFPIPPAIIELGIDVGIVIFKVESNWGGDLTCLYRVRVHGNKMEDAGI